MLLVFNDEDDGNEGQPGMIEAGESADHITETIGLSLNSVVGLSTP